MTPTKTTRRPTAADAGGQRAVMVRLAVLDRFLPVWIGAAMAAGLLLGRLVPGLNGALNRVAIHGTSLPIAVGLRPIPLRRRNAARARVQYLQRPGQCHADAAENLRQALLGFLAHRGAERRPGGDVVQDRADLDLLVELAELVDGFLQARGDRQVRWLDDVPAVGFRVCLANEQEVIDRAVDEFQIAFHVVPVGINASRSAEKALELDEAHHWHGVRLLLVFCGPPWRSAEVHALVYQADRHRALANC